MTPNTNQVKIETQSLMIKASNTERDGGAALGKENEITEQPSGSHSIWDEEE